MKSCKADAGENSRTGETRKRKRETEEEKWPADCFEAL
jgi:hypothetical protein